MTKRQLKISIKNVQPRGRDKKTEEETNVQRSKKQTNRQLDKQAEELYKQERKIDKITHPTFERKV